MDEDKLYYCEDLKEKLRVKTTDTIRKMIKQGKLPPPDVKISQRTRVWKASTLRAWGINFI